MGFGLSRYVLFPFLSFSFFPIRLSVTRDGKVSEFVPSDVCIHVK